MLAHSAGGFINVFLVNASGWTKIAVDDAGFLDFRPPDHPEGQGGGGEGGASPVADKIEGEGVAVGRRRRTEGNNGGGAQEATAEAESAQ